jgi:hypothetical protein
MPMRDLLHLLAVRAGIVRPAVDAFTYLRPNSELPHRHARTNSPLARALFDKRGRPIHKWAHYPELLEGHFARLVGSEVRLLEIGVFQGGSLELWRDHFGPGTTIFGIDIDPACAGRCDPPNQVRIGSQDDGDFLRRTVAEMGGLDVVIDDGSHIGRHQQASFKALWPLLSDGGLYVIEDLLTAYFPGHYEGGYRRRGTGIDLVKDLVDSIQHPFHLRGGVAGDRAWALHLYPGLAVVEKRAPAELAQFRIGE